MKQNCDFFQVASFPCIVGCIDCTYIRNQAPHKDENANKEGFHSINVQTMCDTAGKFTNFVDQMAWIDPRFHNETACCGKDLSQVDRKDLFLSIRAIRVEIGSSHPSEIQVLISNDAQ